MLTAKLYSSAGSRDLWSIFGDWKSKFAVNGHADVSFTGYGCLPRTFGRAEVVKLHGTRSVSLTMKAFVVSKL